MTVDLLKLQNEVSDCLALLQAIRAQLDEQPSTISPDIETPLSVQQAAEFLGIAPQTIYQRIKDLPHTKRFGRLYFYRRSLIEYLNSGEGNTLAYDEADALPFGPVKKKKGGIA